MDGYPAILVKILFKIVDSDLCAYFSSFHGILMEFCTICSHVVLNTTSEPLNNLHSSMQAPIRVPGVKIS